MRAKSDAETDGLSQALAPASAAGEESGFEIVAREDFSDVTFLLEIHHPMLAKSARPGQFVVVITHEHGERVPLTIADFDRSRGKVTLVVQAVGKTTKEMQRNCHPGTELMAVVGPMGAPSHIGDVGKVVCVGGGLGVAPVFPQARAFKETGAYVIGVVGFRSKDLVFWKDKFRKHCDEYIICTDDGSYDGADELRTQCICSAPPFCDIVLPDESIAPWRRRSRSTWIYQHGHRWTERLPYQQAL